MDFLQRNLFAQLRTDNFGTKEELEPMTVFKKKKIAQMMKNLNAVPAGAVLMNNSFLNSLGFCTLSIIVVIHISHCL